MASDTRKQRRKAMWSLFGWLAQNGEVATDPTSELTAMKRVVGAATTRPGPTAANLDLLGQYRKDCRRRDLSPRSVAAYRAVLVTWVSWIGATPMLDAQPGQVETWIDSLNVISCTRYARLSILSGLYQWAMRNELTDRNPTALIPGPKVRQGMPRRPRRRGAVDEQTSQMIIAVCAVLLIVFVGVAADGVTHLTQKDDWGRIPRPTTTTTR